MNAGTLIIATSLASIALAAAAVTLRDRNIFFCWAGFSIISAVFLLFVSPVFAVLKLIFLVLAIHHFIRVFNLLTILANNIEVALNAIRVALTRRQHIIPRMERYVGSYARHERETFRQTVQARGGGARNLLALAESYPSLRASQTYQGLLAELTDAENQVFHRRIAFNEAVRAFNTQLGQFPNALIGRAMGFARRSYETAEQNL